MLISNVIEKLIDCKVIVSNITFDGAQSNKKMCRLLGANLNVCLTKFQPYFDIKDQRIYIIFDPCHMIKLIRNKLAAKEILYDSDGNEIKWQYFVELVRKQNCGFELAHKMNQSHIDWTKKR